MSSAKGALSIVEDLQARVRACTLDRLPAVVEALEGRTSNPRALARALPRAGGALDLRTLAELVLDSKMTGDRLRLVEAAIVNLAVERGEGNLSASARMLGIDRKAMERRADRAKKTA